MSATTKEKPFKFDKDKRVDGPDSCSNGERAERAYRTLLVYCQHMGDGTKPDDEGLRDLLSDLMHLCDEMGMDLDEALALARNNWEAER